MNNRTIDIKMKWWKDARFGMMIHWGLYSVLAGEWKNQRVEYIGEWIMSRFNIPVSEYSEIAERFNPVEFDADKWMSLAARAGMKYLVITTKHHDGFAMYHSQCDPYNIVDATPFKRDPMKELSQACAKHGIKLCFYYSQALDWHEPDAGGAEGGHSNMGMSWTNDWDFPDNENKQFDKYFRKKVIPQIKEILTGYGPIGAIWFDTPLTINRNQCEELYNLVKSIQPDCIINSRLGQGMGDYQSFGDNEAPGRPLEGYWETVATLNDTWGYKSFDNEWKTPSEVISLLSGLASKNVNYVLNVGPDGLGRIPKPSVEVLEKVGKWMDVNSESIHSTDATPFMSDIPWGPVTRRDGTIYFHLHHEPENKFRIYGLRNRAVRAYILGAPQNSLAISQTINRECCILDIALKETPELPTPRVLAVEIEGEPNVVPGIMQQGDESILLSASTATVHSDKKSSFNISATGFTRNWLNCSDWIEWEFSLFKPGKYEIEITTTGADHSRPWKGGHNIKLSVAGQSIETEVKMDKKVEDVSARYYTQAITSCGNINIESPGIHNLTIKPVHIDENDGYGLTLVSVQLRYVEE